MRLRPYLLTRFAALAALVALFCQLGLASNAEAAQKQKAQSQPSSPFEQPITLRASQVLPRALLKGRFHTVEENVRNDGYLNSYTLRSNFGSFRAVSTALLSTRIDEINAMAAMQNVSQSQEFGKKLAEGGESVVKGAVNLISDPLNTLGSAASGVGKLFTRANERMTGNSTSKYEEKGMSNITGFARTKREYAKAFGVDPYSTSPTLQTALDNVARAGFAGGLTAMALKALIPGGVGLVVSSVGGVNWLNDFDVAAPPTELHSANRERLKRMGLPPDLADRFIENDEYTPTQQTLLAMALDKMAHTKDKAEFVRLACTTSNQDQALFRQRMAQMYAGYDSAVGRIDRFVALGHLVGAKTASGKIVLCFPLDYLFWTERTANAVRDMSADMARSGVNSVELWITGQTSPKARKALQDLKIDLHERCGQQLLRERI